MAHTISESSATLWFFWGVLFVFVPNLGRSLQKNSTLIISSVNMQNFTYLINLVDIELNVPINL